MNNKIIWSGATREPTTTWDNTANKGFTESETTSLKRNATTLAGYLEGFLECIGSYQKKWSTSIASVWDIIYEIYDAEKSTVL